MSSRRQEKETLQIIDELEREVRLMNSYSTLISQAVADRLGMHSSDMETLDLLNVLGPMTAGELSRRTGLTTGATTRLIDRLERGGWVRREHDASDRRRVIVAPVSARVDEAGRLFEPLSARLRQAWSDYAPEQLRTVVEFARMSNRIAAEENARLRSARPGEEARDGLGPADGPRQRDRR